MSKVAVLDTKKLVLEPCHSAVARRLLREGKAAVYKRYPFTIILKREVVDPKTTGYTLSVDPGSKCTGLALTDAEGNLVVAFELYHRGAAIKKGLSTRAGHRRSRRTRNIRHRAARWANRSRKSPRLKDGVWQYEKVANTRQTENTFNRVSEAQLRDPRYEWKRIKTTPAKDREKTRLYFAKGQRIRRGELYFEKDGLLYRYNSNNLSHKQYEVQTYAPKELKSKKRWRRVFVGKDTAPRSDSGDRVHNGWIAPSLMSRVFNINTWVNRLSKVYPITQLAVEHVKFDMQLMENPEISGVEYQRGTLFGTEVREYLLEKFGRQCFYCGLKNSTIGYEVEHVLPKSKGGTDRVSNLTIACRECNKTKGNRHPNEIGGKLGTKVQEAIKAAGKTLKDAAAVNTIRWKIVETLKATGLPVICGTGGKTKWHRKRAGLPKTHYYDAACVAGVPKANQVSSVLAIHAVGYGHRQDLGLYQTKQKSPGFKHPYTRLESVDGFQRLDTVELHTIREGKKILGCINSFDKTPPGKPQKLRIQADWTNGDGRSGGNTTQLHRIQRRDGYGYQIVKVVSAEAPVINGNQLYFLEVA